MKKLAKLVRLGNLTMIGLVQYFAFFFLVEQTLVEHSTFLLLIISSITTAMGGYIINNYFDTKTDLINKPNKVVVGNTLRKKHVIILYAVVSICGVMLGFLLTWKIGVINFFIGCLLWFYSYSLQRKPFIGNFIIALLTGGAMCIGGMLSIIFNPLVYVYSWCAFLLTLIREIVKDMEDYKGDVACQYCTLPIVWGYNKTKKFLYFVIGIFGLSVALVNQFYIKLPIYYVILFFSSPLIYLLVKLVQAKEIRDFSYISRICKIAMICGVFSMVLL